MTRVLRVALVLALAAAAGCRDDARAPLRFWAMGREGEVVAELARMLPNVVDKLTPDGRLPTRAEIQRLMG